MENKLDGARPILEQEVGNQRHASRRAYVADDAEYAKSKYGFYMGQCSEPKTNQKLD